MSDNKFSLTRYINESVQSDLLFNEIVNNPIDWWRCLYDDNITSKRDVGMFADHTTTLASHIYKLENLIKTIEEYKDYKLGLTDFARVKDLGALKRLVKRWNDVEWKRMHRSVKKVMNLQYLPILKNAFDLDIANLTDFQLRKYTVKELKKMGNAPTAFKNNNVIFWFIGEDREIKSSRGYSGVKKCPAGSLVAISSEDLVCLDIQDFYYESASKCRELLNKYGIDSVLKFDVDGEEMTVKYVSGAKNAIDALNAFNDPEIMSLFNYNGYEYSYSYNKALTIEDKRKFGYLNVSSLRTEKKISKSKNQCTKVGNFWNPKSFLHDQFGWGDSPNDYMIVFHPSRSPIAGVNPDTGEIGSYVTRFEEYVSSHGAEKNSSVGTGDEYVNPNKVYAMRKDRRGYDRNTYSHTSYDEQDARNGIIKKRYLWDIDEQGNVIPYSIKNDLFNSAAKEEVAKKMADVKSAIAAKRALSKSGITIDILKDAIATIDDNYATICTELSTNFIKHRKVYNSCIEDLKDYHDSSKQKMKEWSELVDDYADIIYIISTNGQTMRNSWSSGLKNLADNRIKSIRESYQRISVWAKIQNLLFSNIAEKLGITINEINV